MIKGTLMLAVLLAMTHGVNAERISSGRPYEKRLQQSITGIVQKPVRVRSLVSNEGTQHYKIQVNGKWVNGRCSTAGAGNLHALLVDLDFDGKADILVTGYTDSQGRSRCSDAWLYDANSKEYVYSTVLSAIQNLEVSNDEKLIEGGISNCGCAAQCFFHDVYRWNVKKLVRVARREQNCETYKEFTLIDDEFVQTKEEPLDDQKYQERQNGNSKFIQWSVDTEIDPQH